MGAGSTRQVSTVGVPKGLCDVSLSARAVANANSQSIPGARCLIDFHLRVLDRLLAVSAGGRLVLLQALRNTPFTDCDVGAMRLQIGLALGGNMIDRGTQFFQLRRGEYKA